MRLPNAVIVGVPKAGTSSLFAWLAAHPQVATSKAKETRYLMDLDSPLLPKRANFHEQGVKGYEALFAQSAPGASVVLEATPDYLYQRTALEFFATVDVGATIIVVLRRPSLRIYSYYQYARGNMAVMPADVTFRDFVGAVRTQAPMLDRGTNLQQTLAYSQYADWIERWQARIDPARMRIYLFEAMVAAPRDFMHQVAADLAIDEHFYRDFDFERQNETFGVRSRHLQRARVELGQRLADSWLKTQLKTAYSRVNVVPAAARPSDDDRAVMAELDAEFAARNDRLASVTGLDLSYWRAG
jgi:sulfotransferase family protein